MDTKIEPGYTASAAKADYIAIVQAVSEHNDAAATGQHYWGVALADGTYMVYEAGTVPPPPTAEELAAQEEAAKKQAEREALPEHGQGTAGRAGGHGRPGGRSGIPRRHAGAGAGRRHHH